MNTKALKVGDKVFYVGNRFTGSGCQRELSVEKVGHKWVQLEGRRRVERGENIHAIDGGDYCSPGSVYESEQTYRAQQAREAAWLEFRRQVDNGYPYRHDVTLADIEAAAKLLKIELAPNPRAPE